MHPTGVLDPSGGGVGVPAQSQPRPCVIPGAACLLPSPLLRWGKVPLRRGVSRWGGGQSGQSPPPAVARSPWGACSPHYLVLYSPQLGITPSITAAARLRPGELVPCHSKVPGSMEEGRSFTPNSRSPTLNHDAQLLHSVLATRGAVGAETERGAQPTHHLHEWGPELCGQAPKFGLKPEKPVEQKAARSFGAGGDAQGLHPVGHRATDTGVSVGLRGGPCSSVLDAPSGATSSAMPVMSSSGLRGSPPPQTGG